MNPDRSGQEVGGPNGTVLVQLLPRVSEEFVVVIDVRKGKSGRSEGTLL